MDAARLLRSARLTAGLTKTALARRASTSPAALQAYETNRRSPTVATFARLLAACGVQVRGELEPLHADTDAVVDDLLARRGGLGLGWGANQVTAAFEASSVEWALDGRSAMAAHGVGDHPDFAVEVVTVESLDLRRLLYSAWAQPVSRDGRPFLHGWLDLDFDLLAYSPMYTRHGFVTMRLAAELPPVVRISVPLAGDEEDQSAQEAVELPVLALPDVEQAHPSLAQVLARLRERRTVKA
jgi:transcriptional regulator with XRE-family HTH domain